jgi:hypothetical protein
MRVKKELVTVSILPEPTPLIPLISTEENDKACNDAIQRCTDLHYASAWSLHHVPLQKCPASAFLIKKRGKIVFPRSYHSVDGNDTQTVGSDQDLNMIVYNWYEGLVNNDT